VCRRGFQGRLCVSVVCILSSHGSRSTPQHTNDVAALPEQQQAHRATTFIRGMSAVVEAGSPAEKDIAAKIEQGLKGDDSILVQDTSGGCGTMYNISVVSEEFAGKEHCQAAPACHCSPQGRHIQMAWVSTGNQGAVDLHNCS